MSAEQAEKEWFVRAMNSMDAVVNAVEPHALIEVEASASWRVEPSCEPYSALSRLMGVRVSDHVG